MGTSLSKPSPTTRLKPPADSETRDFHGGFTKPPRRGDESRLPTDRTARVTGNVKRNGKGKGKTSSSTTPSPAPPQEAKLHISTKTVTATGTPPPPSTSTATPASSAAADAVAPSPGKWTWQAMAPFLRSEGWRCAEGHGFHTWFFVTPAPDGSKSVEYLVSEQEVVAFVRRDETVLARYEAYRRSCHPAVCGDAGAPGCPDEQDGLAGDDGWGGSSAATSTRIASPRGSEGGDGRRPGRARGATPPAVSSGTRRVSKGAATNTKGGCRASTKITQHHGVKQEIPVAGAAQTSTRKCGRLPKGSPVMGRAGVSIKRTKLKAAPLLAEVAATSTARSTNEAPTVTATRTSARTGPSAKYNALVKPTTPAAAVLTTGGSGGATKATSPVAQMMSSGASAARGEQAAKADIPAAMAGRAPAESERFTKDKPAKRSASPSTAAAIRGPVHHSAIVRAAAEAAERAAGSGLPAVKPRAHPRPVPQGTPSETTVDWAGRRKSTAPGVAAAVASLVDWAGRDKSKVPGGYATTFPPAAKYSRVDTGSRAADESSGRSASALSPQRPPRGGSWAGTGEGRLLPGGRHQRHAGPPLGSSRKRSRETTATYAQSWRETWPTLRELGWHWEYQDELGASCVYLKPGVSKDGATLGVDMFDSRWAVLQHVLDAASGAAAGERTTGDSAGPPAGGSRNNESTSVDERARRTSEKPSHGGGKSKPRLGASSSRGDSPVEEDLARVGDGKEKEGDIGRRKSEASIISAFQDALAASRAETSGSIGRAPGPASHGFCSAGTRNERTDKSLGGEGFPADNKGGAVEVAAAAAMEVLGAETTTAEAGKPAPASKWRVGFGSSARGKKLDTTGPPAAPWVVDRLTARCCEQLVALSELGGARGVVSKSGGGIPGGDSRAAAGSSGGGGDSVDGGSPILKRKTSCPDSLPQGSERGGSKSAKKMRERLPAAERDRKVAAVSSTTVEFSAPLRGVGVVVAGVLDAPRADIEEQVVRLGGEVVDIFSKEDGAADGWRACLLGPAGGTAAGGGSAASKIGKNGGGPSARKMMSVAAPGSDHTPEFQLAVAAGMPIVHPSYLGACSRTGSKVDIAGYLMPFGRSALGSRGLIMPTSSSIRERPFQGKTIVLCAIETGPAGAGFNATTVGCWDLVLRVAGATVNVLEDDSGGGGHRCTVDEARQLLESGRVHCVVGSSTEGAARVAAATAVLQAAADAGIPTGTLEWVAQCLAHGRLVASGADTCPLFSVGVVAAGRRADHTTSTTPSGGSGGGGDSAPKTEVGGSATAGGGASVVDFRVHISGRWKYVAGDYVLLGTQGGVSDHVGGGAAGGTTGGESEEARAAAYGGTGPLLPVARVVSFRREVDGAVKVVVEVMKRGEDSKTLIASGGGCEQREMGEDVLGGRVLVMTREEAGATSLYSSKDTGIFCLGD